MRLAAAIILAASLSGCSWFSRSKAPSPESVLAALTPPPAPTTAPAPEPSLGDWPSVPPLASASSFLAEAARAKTEADFARSVELARESARLAKSERDAAASRARLAPWLGSLRRGPR